jgi:hypothetical protein
LNLSPIISFYRECYRFDKNRRILSDIYHSSIRHRHFLENQDDILGGYGCVPSSPEELAQLEKEALLYREEKEILYATGMLVGSIRNDNGELEFVTAPLVFARCQVEDIDGIRMVRRVDHFEFNENFIEKLLSDSSSMEGFRTLVVLLQNQQDRPQNALLSLVSFLKNTFTHMDDVSIIEYPTLRSEKDLKKIVRNAKGLEEENLAILPCSMIGLFEKTDTPRGVLSELDSISTQQDYSEPLKCLLSAIPAGEKQLVTPVLHVPAHLSAPQLKVLTSANSNPLTLVVGPPGTGKSFTIAALATEYLIKGKSVLIVSKTNQALNVIADKLQNSIGAKDCWVRGGRGAYLKELKTFVQNILAGLYLKDEVTHQTLQRQYKKMLSSQRQVNKAEAQLKSKIQELKKTSQLYVSDRTDWVYRFQRWYSNKQLKRKMLLWESYKTCDQLKAESIREAKTYVETLNAYRLGKLLDRDRQTLLNYQKGLRSRTGAKAEDLFAKMDVDFLLKVFPIWLVQLSDLYRVLPLVPNLFDLVIMDEASQCDISSSLPAIYRAKKAVVTGDPQQLRHVSFLSRAKQVELLEAHHLSEEGQWDYSRTSILDLVSQKITRSDQQAFLNEHYRCSPDIIQFSNQHFYAGRIVVMTDLPGILLKTAIEVIDVKGSRDSRGINSEEVSAIVASIRGIIDQGLACSIGVLSPFRHQVDALTDAIRQEFDLETIVKYNLLTGTPYSFQGEERDIMLISLCIDANSHASALRYMEQPDVFNVAITRAKSRQMIFKSFCESSLKTDSMLRKYLSEIGRINPKSEGLVPKTMQSLGYFAQDLGNALEQRGYQVEYSKKIAGCKVDLWVSQPDGCSLIVDLIGYPNCSEEAMPFDVAQRFGRMGLRLAPISYAEWVDRREDILRDLCRT